MIIVTGAAGFIGSALIHGLNTKGITDILAVDALDSSGKWKNFTGLSFADYLDKDDLLIALAKNDAAFSRMDGIIHMGACSSTTESDARFLMRNNYEYTKTLAIWCKANNKRFLYASSAATYGDGNKGFSDDHALLPQLKPMNMYGYSKHLFDLWAQRQGLLSSFVGVKYFNVFGPNEYYKGDMRSMVNKAFSQVREFKKLRLFKSYLPEYKDGEQKRDFLYVKDAVAMTLFLWEKRSAAGIFNIGSGVASTWNVLAEAVFKAMRMKPAIEYVDMPESIRHQYQYVTCADISKVKAAGYVDTGTRLETAIEDYITRYLSQGKHIGEI